MVAFKAPCSELKMEFKGNWTFKKNASHFFWLRLHYTTTIIDYCFKSEKMKFQIILLFSSKMKLTHYGFPESSDSEIVHKQTETENKESLLFMS